MSFYRWTFKDFRLESNKKWDSSATNSHENVNAFPFTMLFITRQDIQSLHHITSMLCKGPSSSATECVQQTCVTMKRKPSRTSVHTCLYQLRMPLVLKWWITGCNWKRPCIYRTTLAQWAKHTLGFSGSIIPLRLFNISDSLKELWLKMKWVLRDINFRFYLEVPRVL